MDRSKPLRNHALPYLAHTYICLVQMGGIPVEVFDNHVNLLAQAMPFFSVRVLCSLNLSSSSISTPRKTFILTGESVLPSMMAGGQGMGIIQFFPLMIMRMHLYEKSCMSDFEILNSMLHFLASSRMPAGLVMMSLRCS